MKHVSPADLDTPVARLLRRSLAHVDKHGWCKRAIKASDGRVCALGAIIFGGDDDNRAIEALRVSIGGGNIAVWNNAPDRTFDDIRSAFIRSIDYANGIRN